MEENKIDFDLSKLTLQELVKVYDEIASFLQFLEENRIVLEEKENNDNE